MMFNSVQIELKAPYGVKSRDMWNTFVYNAEHLGFKIKSIYKPRTGCNYFIDATEVEFKDLIEITRESLI